jgi:hypothetical protein
MSRYIICDVCDGNIEAEEAHSVAQLEFPAAWVHGDSGPVLVDVCSTQCLLLIGTRLNGDALPDVTGETPDQRHDGEVSGSFAPIPEQPNFVSPVKVKTRGERADA